MKRLRHWLRFAVFAFASGQLLAAEPTPKEPPLTTPGLTPDEIAVRRVLVALEQQLGMFLLIAGQRDAEGRPDGAIVEPTIYDVRPGGLAAKAGIVQGDRLSRLRDVPVKGLRREQFYEAFTQLFKDPTVKITVRDEVTGKERAVEMRLPFAVKPSAAK